MIRDMIVLIDGSPGSDVAGRRAVDLAAVCSSHLTIMGLPRDTAEVPHLLLASAKVVIEAMHDAQDAVDLAALQIEKIARAASVQCFHHTLDAPAADYVETTTRIARRFDLCVVALAGPASQRGYDAVFEPLLYRSGVPVLAVPPHSPRAGSYDRVMIAWDGGRAVTRAVGDAIPILRAAKHVDIVNISRNGDGGETEIPGCHIAGHLARHGVVAQYRQIETNASRGAALLLAAGELGADLVVMGAQRHSLLREAIVGGTNSEVIEKSPVPLFLAR